MNKITIPVILCGLAIAAVVAFPLDVNLPDADVLGKPAQQAASQLNHSYEMPLNADLLSDLSSDLGGKQYCFKPVLRGLPVVRSTPVGFGGYGRRRLLNEVSTTYAYGHTSWEEFTAYLTKEHCCGCQNTGETIQQLRGVLLAVENSFVTTNGVTSCMWGHDDKWREAEENLQSILDCILELDKSEYCARTSAPSPSRRRRWGRRLLNEVSTKAKINAADVQDGDDEVLQDLAGVSPADANALIAPVMEDALVAVAGPVNGRDSCAWALA